MSAAACMGIKMPIRDGDVRFGQKKTHMKVQDRIDSPSQLLGLKTVVPWKVTCIQK
jgi:hypothetical protein